MRPTQTEQAFCQRVFAEIPEVRRVCGTYSDRIYCQIPVERVGDKVLLEGVVRVATEFGLQGYVDVRTYSFPDQTWSEMHPATVPPVPVPS